MVWSKHDHPCGDIGGMPPCSRFTADMAFMFVGAGVSLVAMVLAFVTRRAGQFKGTGSTAIQREL